MNVDQFSAHAGSADPLFSPRPKMVGERNPDSVLFSLDKAVAAQGMTTSRPRTITLALPLQASTSGVVDLHALGCAEFSVAPASSIEVSIARPVEPVVTRPAPSWRFWAMMTTLAVVFASVMVLGA